MNARNWIIVAGILGASGVMLGAYHAHGLEGRLTDQGLAVKDVASRMQACDVAIRYHMYHALALLGLGLLELPRRRVLLDLAGTMFLAGTLLFSGGLYLQVFGGPERSWPMIVPVGGLVLIVGWLSLAMSGFTIAVRRDEPDGDD